MCKCAKHPKYTGKRTPRAECLQCWKVWMSNREGPMGTGDLLTIISLLEREIEEIRTATSGARGAASLALDVANGLYR